MGKLKKGFTLVELIVVIAIIGVLAAILVPALLGYVHDSKITACNSNAKHIYTRAAALCTKLDTEGHGGISGRIKKDINGSAWTTGLPSPSEIDDGLGSGSSYVYYIQIVDGCPEVVFASKSNQDRYVGSYPEEATEKCAKPLNQINESATYNKGQKANDAAVLG